jgi:hypothetical protein
MTAGKDEIAAQERREWELSAQRGEAVKAMMETPGWAVMSDVWQAQMRAAIEALVRVEGYEKMLTCQKRAAAIGEMLALPPQFVKLGDEARIRLRQADGMA